MSNSALEYNRKQHLKKYDMSYAQFLSMLAQQGNRCLICQEALIRPCVDHDHETGNVRGLLCAACNSGLGMFKDNVRLLAQAIVYLEAHGKTY